MPGYATSGHTVSLDQPAELVEDLGRWLGAALASPPEPLTSRQVFVSSDRCPRERVEFPSLQSHAPIPTWTSATPSPIRSSRPTARSAPLPSAMTSTDGSRIRGASVNERGVASGRPREHATDVPVRSNRPLRASTDSLRDGGDKVKPNVIEVENCPL
jgi:hypothetical protein